MHESFYLLHEVIYFLFEPQNSKQETIFLSIEVIYLNQEVQKLNHQVFSLRQIIFSFTAFPLHCTSVFCRRMCIKASFLFLLLLLSLSLLSQDINRLRGKMNGLNSASGKGKSDSLVHRDPNADSITISYRFFDSTHVRRIDSSINDWYSRFPIPAYYNYLNNLGQAAYSLLFNPNMQPGFDAGFHSFDIYRFTLAGTKFYQTTRPYTELTYVVGSKTEQMANILHTQNRKNNLNFSFEYRFIASPGAFKNENTSDNNFRISSFYQSHNKRYGLYFIYLNNKLKASENGGLVADSQLQNLSLNNPASATVRLGNGLRQVAFGNVFNSTINTGTTYQESTLYLRQYYDLGQKDSIVHDSTVTRLFYPRLRFQHSISYTTNQYQYRDVALDSTNYIDYYHYYGANNRDSLTFRDRWRDLTNEFSIITFPDKRNVAQFFRVSAELQLLNGTFADGSSKHYTNIFASAEYRNRTRNQKWDVEALGQLYLTGSFIGNYTVNVSLQRQLSQKFGTLQVGFQNTNKSPSQLSDNITSFPVVTNGSFSNTNIAKLYANFYLPEAGLHLYGNYYAVTNYIYFDDFFTAQQRSALFNYINVGGEKKVRLAKHLNWYAEAAFQKAPGNVPIHLPLVFTRSRVAFEGNFYKNLFLSMGIEVRYFTPFKSDGYSPLNGQFYYQTDSTLRNRPDVNVYLNFRIKSFKAFLRLENLNTLDKDANGVGFVNHNFAAPHYPQNSLWLRFGIWWNFVN